jgi:HK97 family phage portal protein
MSIRSALAKFMDEARDPGMMSLELRNDPLNNPAVPLSSPALWQWLQGGEPTAAGELVTDLTALQITTVYRCVRFIAESIASLPLDVWETISGGREKAVDQDVYYLLSTEPNPEMSAFTFKETWFGCCSLTGNGYAQIERNSAGRAVGLWPLHPHKTKPIRQQNILMYQTSDGMPPGQTRIISAEDMLHIALFSLDGVWGLSPVGLVRQALGLTKAAEKFGARWFGNGSRPAGVVFNKGPRPDPKVQKEIIESWQREQGGTNQGKTAFLFGGEWDYKAIGLSPEDSQFLETRKYQRADIAALWGLPPHYVGDTSRMSGNNAEQEGLRVVTDTLRPYLSRAENEIDRKLMPHVGRKANLYFVKFDVSERLRGDFKTQQEGFAAGVQWGWFSPNDVRRKLGENPGPKELDVYRSPVNMQSAKTLLSTESIQDQPVGSGASEPPAAEGDADGDPEPTAQERKLLGVYTRSFINVYRDAFVRLSRRDRRDSDAIDSLFRPVLTSITGLAIEQNGIASGIPASDEWLTGDIVADVLKSMEKRAAKWPAQISAVDLDGIASQEFLKAVRTIHISTSREWAGVRAAREVESAQAD